MIGGKDNHIIKLFIGQSLIYEWINILCSCVHENIDPFYGFISLCYEIIWLCFMFGRVVY